MFTFYACNDPVSWADDVTALQRINPAVVVHDVSAVLAHALTVKVWGAVIANNVALPLFLLAFLRCELAQFAVLKSVVCFAVIKWVVAILEPLSGIDDYGFFTVLQNGAS